MADQRTYDLEERLLEFSANVIRLLEHFPNTVVFNHIAKQMVRSGTSPYANHGEAQSAESSADFIHKMKIGLKELRETARWLKLIQRINIKTDMLLNGLLQENDELIRIFVTSIRTARTNAAKGKQA